MEYRMKVLFFEIKVSEEILTHTKTQKIALFCMICDIINISFKKEVD